MPSPRLNNPFLRDVDDVLDELQMGRSRISDVDEAYSAILAELSILWQDAIRAHSEANELSNVRADLVRLAATAWRAARDLGIE